MVFQEQQGILLYSWMLPACQHQLRHRQEYGIQNTDADSHSHKNTDCLRTRGQLHPQEQILRHERKLHENKHSHKDKYPDVDTHHYAYTHTNRNMVFANPIATTGCEAEASLFSHYSTCEDLRFAPGGSSAREWLFDDCDYCRDAANPCFTTPCTFAMYVVAECGTEMHIRFMIMKPATFRLKIAWKAGMSIESTKHRWLERYGTLFHGKIAEGRTRGGIIKLPT